MNQYRIFNTRTHQWQEIEADSAREACAKFGWLLHNCTVKQWVYSGKPSTSGGPCNGGWGEPRE